MDVYLDGARTFRPSRFGQLSGYQTYRPGDLRVQVVRRGGNPATTLYIFGLVNGNPGLSAATGRDR